MPPAIHNRGVLFQKLGEFVSQMRAGSERFVVFPIGEDYACVGRCGTTAKAAILVGAREEKVAAVRLVRCPALLHKLQILMSVSPGGDGQPESDFETGA